MCVLTARARSPGSVVLVPFLGSFSLFWSEGCPTLIPPGAALVEAPERLKRPWEHILGLNRLSRGGL